MVASLRFLVRSATINCQIHTRASTTAATSTALRTCVLINACRSTYRRGLQTSATQVAEHELSTEPVTEQAPIRRPSQQNDPNWRRTSFGFVDADLPRLIRIDLPHNTTENDVKLILTAAGYSE
jgi:hypothetical protein